MSSKDVVDVSAETWETDVLKADSPVIVDFWHDHCGWCIRLNPIYDELAAEYVGVLKFVKLNVLESQDNRQIAVQYGIMGTPTMKIFCQGRPVGEIVGFRSPSQLKEEIDMLLQHREECLEKSTSLLS
jgi:thioredoxin 1